MRLKFLTELKKVLFKTAVNDLLSKRKHHLKNKFAIVHLKTQKETFDTSSC